MSSGPSINIFSTVNSYTNKCRFCYSYTPPGPIENCCPPVACTTNERIELISSLQMVTFNSTRTTERSLLLAGQQQFFSEISAQQTASTVQATLANTTGITNTLIGQLIQVQRDRYLPYQPYVPEVMPQHVIDLQMSTINVGVPHTVFTCADGKGVQFVTT
jgi:hypothetical protein